MDNVSEKVKSDKYNLNSRRSNQANGFLVV